MLTCYETWLKMMELTHSGIVRNFHQDISMANYVVETDLFTGPTLEAYSAWNLGKEVMADQKALFSELKGGSQGDYREKISEKISNVIDCLTKFPKSKRAVITIPNNSTPAHQTDDDAKCMREIHFYLDEGKLCGTVLFRAQAAIIFPKNIHFIGSMMTEIAHGLPEKPPLGSLHYLATTLVHDRQ